MSTKYNLVSAASSPVELGEMKSYLKMSHTNIDDKLIKTFINSATQLGEQYTDRDFRVKTYELLLDDLSDRIKILADKVNSITKIEYTLLTVLTTIVSSTYYLKNLQQFSEVILAVDKTWPTDNDDIEQGYRIEFKTEAWEYIEEAKLAIMKHVAHLYLNRGDCDTKNAMDLSGATYIYDQWIIPRI